MLILLLSFFPVLLSGIYIYYNNKESNVISNLSLGSFFASLIITFVSIFGKLVFPNFFQILDEYTLIEKIISIFIGLALIEEGVRWFILYLTIYNVDKRDTNFDGVFYSVFISLCTAFIQNIFYVIGGGLTFEMYMYFTSFSLHACLGVIMGYFLVKAKNDKKNRVLNLIMSLVLPIILYCLHFYSLYSGSYILRIIYLILILLFIIYVFIIKKHQKK